MQPVACASKLSSFNTASFMKEGCTLQGRTQGNPSRSTFSTITGDAHHSAGLDLRDTLPVGLALFSLMLPAVICTWDLSL